MAQNFVRNPNNTGVLPPVIGKNSEALLRGTPVTIDGNGFLAGCTSSGEKVYGYCLEDKTMASDNQTVAQYCPLVIDPREVVIRMDCATVAQTDVGEYGDVATNSSGAITMGNPSTSGQFILVQLDPDSTTSAYWMVAEPQQLAFAQA